jgi:two-component system response regulator NreC
MKPVRVLIVDDHAVVRAGIRMLIDAQQDLQVVGEAEDAIEAVRKSRELDPDVVVMDVAMPGESGIKAIERMRGEGIRSRVLALTMHDDIAYLRAVLAAGGAGYVIKRAGDAELLAAIRTVSQGRTYVSVSLGELGPSDLEAALQQTPASKSTAEPSGLQRLTKREREVLILLAQGHTNREAAERLCLSVKTVETHRARIGDKLGLRSRADLIRFALEVGLLTDSRD